jgi:hypothetical protein
MKSRAWTRLKNDAPARSAPMHDDRFAGTGELSSGDAEELCFDDLPDRHGPLNDRMDFEDYYSEELVRLYHLLIDAAADAGWPLFDRLDFCDFAKFAFDKSSRYKMIR